MEQQGQRALSTILADIANSIARLIRSELNLIRMEITQNTLRIAKRSIFLVGCAFLALFSVIALMAALIIGLGHLLHGQYGLSSLLVGSVGFSISVYIFTRSLKQVQASTSLPVSATNLKADQAAVSMEVREISQNIIQGGS